MIERRSSRLPPALAIAVAALILLPPSCVFGGSSPPAQVGPLTLKPGESATYSLYTHCGVIEVTINGTPYYADPPLSDGNGNPPAGWGNPYDAGTITLTTATSADFQDAKGNKAHFISNLSGPAQTVPTCD